MSPRGHRRAASLQVGPEAADTAVPTRLLSEHPLIPVLQAELNVTPNTLGGLGWALATAGNQLRPQTGNRPLRLQGAREALRGQAHGTDRMRSGGKVPENPETMPGELTFAQGQFCSAL